MALSGIITHRKTRRLARLLGVSIPVAVGYLECLWHVTREQRPRGDIGSLSNADIADEMFAEIEPDRLVEAYLQAGWLEAHPELRLVVHDWSEHADEHVRKKLHRAKATFWDGKAPWCKTHSARSEKEPESTPQGVESAENYSVGSPSRAGAQPEPEPGPEPEPEPVSPLPPLASEGQVSAGDPPGGGGVIPFPEPKPPDPPPADASFSDIEAWLAAEEAHEEARLKAAGYKPTEVEVCIAALRDKRSIRALRLKCGGNPETERAGKAVDGPRTRSGIPKHAGNSQQQGLAELRNAMTLFRPDWPEPDLAMARKALEACGGAPVREILTHLGELHRKGLRPDLSWDWFPKVLRKRFNTPQERRKGKAKAAGVGT